MKVKISLIAVLCAAPALALAAPGAKRILRVDEGGTYAKASAAVQDRDGNAVANAPTTLAAGVGRAMISDRTNWFPAQ